MGVPPAPSYHPPSSRGRQVVLVFIPAANLRRACHVQLEVIAGLMLLICLAIRMRRDGTLPGDSEEQQLEHNSREIAQQSCDVQDRADQRSERGSTETTKQLRDVRDASATSSTRDICDANTAAASSDDAEGREDAHEDVTDSCGVSDQKEDHSNHERAGSPPGDGDPIEEAAQPTHEDSAVWPCPAHPPDHPVRFCDLTEKEKEEIMAADLEAYRNAWRPGDKKYVLWNPDPDLPDEKQGQEAFHDENYEFFWWTPTSYRTSREKYVFYPGNETIYPIHGPVYCSACDRHVWEPLPKKDEHDQVTAVQTIPASSGAPGPGHHTQSDEQVTDLPGPQQANFSTQEDCSLTQATRSVNTSAGSLEDVFPNQEDQYLIQLAELPVPASAVSRQGAYPTQEHDYSSLLSASTGEQHELRQVFEEPCPVLLDDIAAERLQGAFGRQERFAYLNHYLPPEQQGLQLWYDEHDQSIWWPTTEQEAHHNYHLRYDEYCEPVWPAPHSIETQDDLHCISEDNGQGAFWLPATPVTQQAPSVTISDYTEVAQEVVTDRTTKYMSSHHEDETEIASGQTVRQFVSEESYELHERSNSGEQPGKEECGLRSSCAVEMVQTDPGDLNERQGIQPVTKQDDVAQNTYGDLTRPGITHLRNKGVEDASEQVNSAELKKHSSGKVIEPYQEKNLSNSSGSRILELQGTPAKGDWKLCAAAEHLDREHKQDPVVLGELERFTVLKKRFKKNENSENMVPCPEAVHNEEGTKENIYKGSIGSISLSTKEVHNLENHPSSTEQQSQAPNDQQQMVAGVAKKCKNHRARKINQVPASDDVNPTPGPSGRCGCLCSSCRGCAGHSQHSTSGLVRPKCKAQKEQPIKVSLSFVPLELSGDQEESSSPSGHSESLRSGATGDEESERTALFKRSKSPDRNCGENDLPTFGSSDAADHFIEISFGGCEPMEILRGISPLLPTILPVRPFYHPEDRILTPGMDVSLGIGCMDRLIESGLDMNDFIINEVLNGCETRTLFLWPGPPTKPCIDFVLQENMPAEFRVASLPTTYPDMAYAKLDGQECVPKDLNGSQPSERALSNRVKESDTGKSTLEIVTPATEQYLSEVPGDGSGQDPSEKWRRQDSCATIFPALRTPSPTDTTDVEPSSRSPGNRWKRQDKPKKQISTNLNRVWKKTNEPSTDPSSPFSTFESGSFSSDEDEQQKKIKSFQLSSWSAPSTSMSDQSTAMDEDPVTYGPPNVPSTEGPGSVQASSHIQRPVTDCESRSAESILNASAQSFHQQLASALGSSPQPACLNQNKEKTDCRQVERSNVAVNSNNVFAVYNTVSRVAESTSTKEVEVELCPKDSPALVIRTGSILQNYVNTGNRAAAVKTQLVNCNSEQSIQRENRPAETTATVPLSPHSKTDCLWNGRSRRDSVGNKYSSIELVIQDAFGEGEEADDSKITDEMGCGNFSNVATASRFSPDVLSQDTDFVVDFEESELGKLITLGEELEENLTCPVLAEMLCQRSESTSTPTSTGTMPYDAGSPIPVPVPRPSQLAEDPPLEAMVWDPTWLQTPLMSPRSQRWAAASRRSGSSGSPEFRHVSLSELLNETPGGEGYQARANGALPSGSALHRVPRAIRGAGRDRQRLIVSPEQLMLSSFLAPEDNLFAHGDPAKSWVSQTSLTEKRLPDSAFGRYV